MAQRLALVIGNSVFRDQTLARLLKPDADVGALADVLLDKEIGAFDDVKLLVNMSSTQVRRAISDFYSKKQRDDLLLLYFSGHGVLDDQGRLHLAVKDTERALLRATAIPSAFITEEMNNSRSRRQVLILDCCHSGAFARGAKGATGASVGTASAFEGTGFGRLVLTATDATQYAWEGDQVIGEAENSVFTHYLIQGLKTGQADSDGDGRITVDELYDYTYEQVVQKTPKQTPGKWSYREQGEIVLAHTPGVVPEPQITSALSELDDEAETKAAQLYNKGLAAYYLDEWDKAARYFKAVLELQPDQQEAATKLTEAQRQARLNKLYDEAHIALETGEWNKASAALDTLASEAPDFKDVASKLEYANKQKMLSDMYDEARQIYKAQEWQAVVNVLSKIKKLDPDYPDPDNLLENAKAEAALLERQKELASLYNRALHEMDAGHWSESRQLFLQVLEMEPGYEDSERLLNRTETEIHQAEVERQREEQISSLYLEAQELFEAHKWKDVFGKLEEIQALDPDFPDPDDIGSRAQVKNEKERAEKRRQQLINMVQDPKQDLFTQVLKRKWVLIGSVIALGLVFIVVMSLLQMPPFNQVDSPEKPTEQAITSQISVDTGDTTAIGGTKGTDIPETILTPPQIIEGDEDTTGVGAMPEESIPVPTEFAILQFWTTGDEEERVGNYETIATQWAGSGHADKTAEVFRHWDEDDPPEVPDRCAKCHTPTGFIEFVGADGSAPGVIENNHPLPQGIECIACHNNSTVVMDTVVFPSGAVITGLGPEAHCMQCHQGRISKFNVDEMIEGSGLTGNLDTPSEELHFQNIHYYATAATIFGSEAMGGYEYENKTYNGKYEHVAGYDTCLGCHDPHTLERKYDECAECHEGVASDEDARNIRMEGSEVDYDGDGDTEEGIAFEIEGLREMLYQAIQAYAAEVAGVPIVYEPNVYPFFLIDTNEDGEVDEDEATYENRYNTWTGRLLQATYNYQMASKDPGAYMHGGKYIMQLLYDSIEDLNSVISTPVDLPTDNRITTGAKDLYGNKVVLNK